MKGIYTKILIAEILNKQGFKTKTGKKASSQFVSRFFKNPFYKGIIVSKVRDRPYNGIYQKMFEPEEWQRIQDISDGSSFTAVPRKRNNPEFPLRHFAFCGKCGEHVTASYSSGNGGKYAYYRCPKHKPNFDKDTVERDFYTLLQKIKPTEETIQEFTKILKSKYEAKYKTLTADIGVLDNEIVKLETTRRKLLKKNMSGVYDDDLYKAADDELKEKIMILRMQMNEAAMEKLDIDEIANFAEHFLNNIAQTWKNTGLSTKQRLQEIIFPEGVYYHFPGFETNTLSCLFNIFRESKEENVHLG